MIMYFLDLNVTIERIFEELYHESKTSSLKEVAKFLSL